MPKVNTKPVYWNVPIDVEVAEEVNELLRSDIYQRPRYGARSELINALLRKYIKERKDRARMQKEEQASND